MPWFEDTEIGGVRELGSVAFSQESIVAFAKAYDPQPFHIDPEAAKASQFGGLCASGWHTAAACMRLVVDWHRREREAEIARGETPAIMGPSPGFRDLKWLRPVYPGDTISYSTEIVGKRLSASRPGWGITTHRLSGKNQRSEPVIEFTSTAFTPCRAP
jgi:acyl dehydratase